MIKEWWRRTVGMLARFMAVGSALAHLSWIYVVWWRRISLKRSLFLLILLWGVSVSNRGLPSLRE